MTPTLPCAALLLATVLGLANAGQAATLHVVVSKVRSEAGTVRCGLFNDPGGFRKPDHELRLVNAQPAQGQAICRFDNIPPGDYAVAAFHAEKDEAHVEYGLFGQPRQGVAFSNNPSITFGPPSFEDALFSVQGDQTDLNIQLKY